DIQGEPGGDQIRGSVSGPLAAPGTELIGDGDSIARSEHAIRGGAGQGQAHRGDVGIGLLGEAVQLTTADAACLDSCESVAGDSVQDGDGSAREVGQGCGAAAVDLGGG